MADISSRKVDHIELCAQRDVEYREGALFEDVQLVHDSLPELALDEVDPSTSLVGRRLRAPVLVTGMTGGVPEAATINRAIAVVVEDLGLGMGLGSQRPMWVDPNVAYSYQLRAQAPTALILGNIGVVQARDASLESLRELVDAIGADALCVHLNPAQEMAQPGGDRDFRGCLAAIGRLVSDLGVPIVVKETGCGLSPAVVERLSQVGVEAFDVSGAGGTTWVGVEELRGDAHSRPVAAAFREWGIPTAAILLGLRGANHTLIASGGIRSGLDVAKAVALGARLAGLALPVLRAFKSGGQEGVHAKLSEIVMALKTAMLLTGSRDLESLSRARLHCGERLQSWARSLSR